MIKRVALLLGFGLGVAGTMIGGVGMVLSAIGFVLAMYSLLVLGGKKAKIEQDIDKKYKDMKVNHAIEIQNKKMALLEARFAKMGLAPLTEEEKKEFVLDDYDIQTYYENKSPSKSDEGEDW